MAFYLEAKCIPSAVRDIMAHAGLAISATATTKMLESLRKEQFQRFGMLGPSKLTSIAYDNLDFQLNTGTTTSLNRNVFESIATGLYFRVVLVLVGGICCPEAAEGKIPNSFCLCRLGPNNQSASPVAHTSLNSNLKYTTPPHVM